MQKPCSRLRLRPRCRSAAAAAQTEIKFGHVGEPGSLFDLSAQEFAKRANAKLGNKAKVVVYGSSQLGGDAELMKKLKLGTVDLALPSTVMSSQVPAFGVFEMPYLVKDRDHMAKIRDQVVVPSWSRSPKRPAITSSRVWENGFRQITNNKHPDRKAGRPCRASSCACRRAAGA